MEEPNLFQSTPFIYQMAPARSNYWHVRLIWRLTKSAAKVDLQCLKAMDERYKDGAKLSFVVDPLLVVTLSHVVTLFALKLHLFLPFVRIT